VFEVEADGRLVYSKRQLGRFPEPGEVATAIKNG
jgi:predicted Rdx family selenoprotein